MSTLRVSNIQDTSGGNTSTPAGIANGIAKAWVNFDGTGTIATRASYNVSSITDNAVGDYTINFTSAIGSGTPADYAVVGTANNSTSTLGTSGIQGVVQDSNNPPTTTSVRIRCHRSTVAYVDNTLICVAIFR